MKRFQALDSFRGLLALAVVMYHAHAVNTFTELRFFRNADYFVDFFFVLSGFVVCFSYGLRLNTWQQVRDFAVTRTLRLYPLHLVMLAVALAIECTKVVGEAHGMSFGSHSFKGLRAVDEILPNLFLLQSWWSGFEPLSFNYPAWSISIEYYTYMLFALMLWWLPRQARAAFAVIAVTAMVLLSVDSVLLTTQALQGLSCFFAGVITYQVYNVLGERRLSRRLGVVLEVTVLSVIVLLLGYFNTPPKALMALLFCVAVLVFAFEAGSVSTLLGKRPFRRLGKLSYSIYLTHATLLVLSYIVLKALGNMAGITLQADLPETDSGVMKRYIATGSLLLNNALLLGQLLGVLMVSALTYRYIELPAIAAGKRWLKREPALATAPNQP